jgi:hypothetical protein
MSDMSRLERTARTVAAISLLNELRHYVSGRTPKIDNERIRLLDDAIKITQDDGVSGRMIRYGFRAGATEGGSAPVLELSEVILESYLRLAQRDEDWEEYQRAINNFIDSDGQPDQSDRHLLEKFTEVAMQVLSASMRQKPKNAFETASDLS